MRLGGTAHDGEFLGRGDAFVAVLGVESQSQESGYASIRGGTRERGREIARFRDDADCRLGEGCVGAGLAGRLGVEGAIL